MVEKGVGRMAKRLYGLFLALCLLPGLGAPACAAQGEVVRITDLYTDKARYAPGETVRAVLIFESASPVSGTVLVTARHLDQYLVPSLTFPFEAGAGQTSLEFDFKPPEMDYQGYLLEASLQDGSGAVLDKGQVALDVSSVWTKFPRYGYLWDFTENAPAREKIEALAKYHINGLQYYDWQYRHHIPLSPDTKKWQDWSGRWIYGDVIESYIAAAREKAMVNMAYNMVYGANKTYLRDGTGVDPAWRLVKADGQDFTCVMSQSRGSTGILQFFNILNEGWQAYIFRAEKEAIENWALTAGMATPSAKTARCKRPKESPLASTIRGGPSNM
jgi:dextranase